MDLIYEFVLQLVYSNNFLFTNYSTWVHALTWYLMAYNSYETIMAKLCKQTYAIQPT